MILPLIHSEEITDHDMAYYLLNKYLREHEGYVKIKKFWQDQPMSALALVILFDQFSRNMFRDDKKAFAQDHKTRLIVNDAVYAGYLESMNESERFFMILPLIHSEEITDHDMAYYLLNKYLREHEGYVQIKKFWKDHTKVIKLFHRYPHRNKVLGRESTEEELAFLNGPNSSW